MIVIPGYGRQEYQPASPGSVDWGNTISSGLIFALDRGVNCFNGREFTKTGTKLGLTKKGIAVGIGSTVGVGTTDVINTGVTASPSAGLSLVIAFTCNGTGGGGFGRLLQKGASGNGETQIYITGTNNRLIFQRYNSSATRLFEGYITDSSTTINDGKLHVLEVYQDGSVSAPISFVDGVLQTDHATAGAGGGTGTTSDPYLIGNRYDGTRAWDGYILSAFGFSRVLSDHEKISLRVNHWQLFQAEDSTTIIVGGVGSHSASGALAGSAGTVSGTATHYTLHSSSGVLSGGSGTVAGAATHLTLHSTSGALSGSAGEISGTAARWHAFSASGDLVGSSGVIEGSATLTTGVEHGASGVLSGGDGVVSGTATHLTLHTSIGSLIGAAGELSGIAAHYMLHSASGALSGSSGVIAGTAVHSGPGAIDTGTLYIDLLTGKVMLLRAL